MNSKFHLLQKASPSRLGEVAVSSNTKKQTQRVKQNEETEKYVPNKKDKTSGEKKKNLNETKISNFPDKEFKVMVIKMLTSLGRRMDEHSENFNKETENTRKFQTEVMKLKNTITKLKNTLQGFNSR